MTTHKKQRTHALEQIVCWAATQRAVVTVSVLLPLCCLWVGGASFLTTLLCAGAGPVLAAFVITRVLSTRTLTNSEYEAHQQSSASGCGFPISTATMLLQVLFIGRPGLQRGGTLPELSVTLTGVTVSDADMQAYSKACQLEQGVEGEEVLPLLFLESFARPLSLYLATHPMMTLNLLGSVHARTTVSTGGRIRSGDRVDIRCSVHPATRPHRRGVEFDLITEYWRAGILSDEVIGGQASTEVLYRTTMTVICFTKQNSSQTPAAAPSNQLQSFDRESFDRGAPVQHKTMAFAAAAGREFARVTGDYNPIHISSIAARLFGQRGTIIHGMCVCGVMAQEALSSLEREHEPRDRFYEFEVAFKGPVVIPSTVQIRTLHPSLVRKVEEDETDGGVQTVYIEAQELTNTKVNIVARLHSH